MWIHLNSEAKTTRSSLIKYFSNWINAYLDSNHFICGIFFFLNNIVHILFYYFFIANVLTVSQCPGTEGKRKTRICGIARLFTLCPAYIKHSLLLQLEQKGKQCHQVKYLRIPQTPLQTDLSCHQRETRRRS